MKSGNDFFLPLKCPYCKILGDYEGADLKLRILKLKSGSSDLLLLVVS